MSGKISMSIFTLPSCSCGHPRCSIEADRIEMEKARAAVAELVEAQRKAHDAMLLADWNVQALCSPRQHSAYLASAASLAAFEVTP